MRPFELLLKNRSVVVMCLLGILVWGAVSYHRLPTDAFPDISPVMVPVFAEAHGLAPEEIERLLTFPIESAMNGLPGVTMVKSTSAFGMAVVYVYFKDGMDIYFARQIVAERLAGATSDLPEMHDPPALGPISTGLGEVFMYYLTMDPAVDTQGKDPRTFLRELNDWVVKYQLQTVQGVTEILSMGGHVLQYQIRLDPYLLNTYDLGLDDVVQAINANNRNAGGQFLVLGSEEHLVRGIGLVQTLKHLRDIQVRVVDGTPVRLLDIAEVGFGNEVRRGVVTRNGTEEVVAGIVMKLYGENTSEVIKRLSAKFPEVQKSLPEGVALLPYYNQKRLVDNATGTVKTALLQGGALVVLTLFLFLGNVRTAFIVSLSLPICALFAVILMGVSGLSANLMSLGGIAIAIGMLGDGAIVMVENTFRHLSDNRNRSSDKTELIAAAAREVARPILFSVAIIVVVFLPLFTLQGVEGKMFSPMAVTISSALLGSVVAALVFAPVLSSFLLSVRPRPEFFLLSWLKRVYRPLLQRAIRIRTALLVAAGAALAGALVLMTQLGTEFIPVLEEGVLQINVTMAPSISLEKATETIMRLERIINDEYDDAVEQTIAKIGRPEAGSHPHPVNFANIQLTLRPDSDRERYRSKADLVQSLNRRLGQYPGVQLSFTQPIQNLFDELLSGVRTQLAVKLYGDDLEVLRAKADEIHAAVEGIPGLVDLASEQSHGQPQVQIIADRDACARYGVNVSEILEMVELAIGGEVIDQIFLNTRRFGIHIRFKEQYRRDPEALRNLMVHTGDGALVPLSQVAEVKETVGPIQVNREKNQRRWTVAANIRGCDIGSVVSDMRQRIDGKIELPPGYWYEFGGQFENQQRAMRRLNFIVPAALLLIFFMLYLALGTLRQAVLIFVNVPLALIGGVIGLFLTGEYLSVPASVGFIVLFGIVVQNGLVLVTYINQLREQGSTMDRALVEGGLMRLRPVLMTALTTVLGLLPLLLAQGMGSEVQRPLAVVVVFGLLTSTALTLILIPALYPWFAPMMPAEEKNRG